MTPENNKNLIAAIEALLFAHGEPIEIKKISKILGIEEEKIKPAIDEFSKLLNNESRGLKLISDNHKVQLATKPEFSVFLENFIKEELKESLTPATLETLSLIAYRGPISRAQIDYFRGVNSTFILRSLLMRGLIERVSGVESGERGYFYQISFDLLKHLGISKVEDLPEYEKYKQKILNKEQVDEPKIGGEIA